jgi:hypothetical protein
MSEAFADQSPSSPYPTDDLLLEIEGQTSHPPGGDPIIGNMWEGFLSEVSGEPGLGDIFDTFRMFHGEGPASERAGLLRTIFMADVLRSSQPYEEAIPRSYEQWCDYFQGLGQDYQEHDHSTDPEVGARIDDLTFSLFDTTREVQTNIARRYVSAELVMQSDRKFRDGVVWLDVGCGIQQGQHALALKDEEPLDGVQIAAARTGRQRPRLQEKVNELLARPSLIRAGIGVDLFDPKDQKSKRWVRASLRPTTELLNGSFMTRYDTLADAEVPHIEAKVLDITDEEAVTRFLDEMPDFRPNLVTLYTFPHQLEKKERGLSKRNIRRIASPDATLLLQDFAYPVSPQPNFLRYYKNWHDEPYRYSMFRRDLGTEQDYWRQQINFDESHGATLKLSREMIKAVLGA